MGETAKSFGGVGQSNDVPNSDSLYCLPILWMLENDVSPLILFLSFTIWEIFISFIIIVRNIYIFKNKKIKTSNIYN